MKMRNLLRYGKTCTLFLIMIVCIGIVPGQAAYSRSLSIGFGDSETPPLKWKKEGEYLGVYINVVREITSRTKVDIEVKPTPYKRLLHNLQTGELDGAIGMFKTAEREQFATYVDIPIAWLSMQAFVKKGDEFSIKAINDLSGKVVGKVRGVSVSKDFDQAMQQGLFSVEETKTYKQSIQKLRVERIDVMIAPGLPTQFLLNEIGLAQEIVMLPHPLALSRPLYFLFSKAASTPQKEAMFEKIRQALREMKHEKRFERIIQRYGVLVTQ